MFTESSIKVVNGWCGTELLNTIVLCLLSAIYFIITHRIA